MTVIKIAAAAVIVTLTINFLKKHNSPFAILAELGLTVLIAALIFPEIAKFKSDCDAVLSLFSGSGGIFKMLFKSFGILFLSSLAADFCRDNSENAAAGIVEAAGKVLALSAALPIFSAVFNLAAGLLQ